MTTRTIPIELLLEYLKACQPVVARVSDRIRPHDPLSTAVMPLVAAFTLLEQAVRQYQRQGKWAGTPVFLTTQMANPRKPMLMLVPHRKKRG